MRDFKGKAAQAFSSELLAEIPAQLCGFMRSKHIVPKTQQPIEEHSYQVQQPRGKIMKEEAESNFMSMLRSDAPSSSGGKPGWNSDFVEEKPLDRQVKKRLVLGV